MDGDGWIDVRVWNSSGGQRMTVEDKGGLPNRGGGVVWKSGIDKGLGLRGWCLKAKGGERGRLRWDRKKLGRDEKRRSRVQCADGIQ